MYTTINLKETLGFKWWYCVSLRTQTVTNVSLSQKRVSEGTKIITKVLPWKWNFPKKGGVQAGKLYIWGCKVCAQVIQVGMFLQRRLSMWTSMLVGGYTEISIYCLVLLWTYKCSKEQNKKQTENQPATTLKNDDHPPQLALHLSWSPSSSTPNSKAP